MKVPAISVDLGSSLDGPILLLPGINLIYMVAVTEIRVLEGRGVLKGVDGHVIFA